MDWLFDAIFNDLHPPGAENNPYDLEVEDVSIERPGWREAGIAIAVTMRAIDRAFTLYGGTCKLQVTPPVPTSTRASALCVWGDHCFMVGDSRTKSEIAPSIAVKPHLRPSTDMKVIVKCDDPLSGERQEWSGTLAPGHFYTSDLARVRFDLHSQGFCPKVQLNGMGSMTCLRLQGATIYRRLLESLIWAASNSRSSSSVFTRGR
jgi:hypothetical protein